MQISAALVKELRERTSAGVIDCRDALVQMDGDLDKASELLRKQGLDKAEKRAGREAKQGLIETYVHFGGRLGVMVEVNCETDFVAKTDEFRQLAHDLALQIAGGGAVCVSSEDLPEGTDLDSREACLLEQKSIRDDTRTIRDIITETAAKTGEKVSVARFVRFELGNREADGVV
jgi:elongation factor Ts